jgi:hypothetical protein
MIRWMLIFACLGLAGCLENRQIADPGLAGTYENDFAPGESP